ncbi:MAG TPA: adenosylmethionine--8-amino-7-oxononanoate transaminase [Aeromicrobium sp.]|nr:adenosylmethionine--8-amino-7-oxononanoate transaminase [Aeromicrobium sp.]
MNADDILAADAAHVWHPYAAVGATPFGVVTGAEGVRLEFADGTVAIDAMSSWWAAIHGYRNPTLDAAAIDQLGRAAHVMFGGLTHEPGVTLATRLAAMTGLDHVFFADSGSVSVEVALKMALQFQRGTGHPERTRFVTIAGGYHGDTFGAMSVCDPISGMHSMFTDVLRQQTFLPRPPAGLDVDIAAWSTECASILDGLDDVAAIIIEPVLQGAGGMYIYPPAAVRWLAEQASDRGWLLVLDEIATGFFRLGETSFAFERVGVRPDIVCVGKALSGGYLSLAATMCTREVSDGIDASESGVLMHGPTYMANPLACAVANASLELLATHDVPDRIRAIETGLTSGLAPARGIPGVADVRTLGAVGVIQLEHPVDLPSATRAALDHGVWIRPFGHLIYAMPPFITSPADVEQIAVAMLAAAKASAA